jgi:phytoene synthase
MRAEWRFPNRATPPGSSSYYSVRFSPGHLRHDLAALLAWRHEVRGIIDEVSDPGVARLKLQWWREELERTRRGEPRHPLSQVLGPVMESRRLPTEPFHRMADGVDAEIRRRQPTDESALEDACDGDQGSLFELMTRCHGVADEDLLGTARRLGAYCARVYLIRDSGALVRQGRAVFPANWLRARGLSAEALTQRDRRGNLPQLLAAAAGEARSAKPSADQVSRLPPSIRVRASILSALLEELERSGFDLADRRIGLTPLRKLWIAWRESRRR